MDIFFGIILFFIIAAYLFRLFIRYGLPYILGRFIRKQQENFAGGFQQNDFSQKKSTNDGEVKVKRKKSTTKQKDQSDKTFGEYVEFEDVD